MRRPAPKNVAASIQARLKNLARERGEDNQFLLTQFAGERLLYRLSRSPYRDRFILKGARLFELWTGEMHRPTRDIDFLGHGSPALAEIIRVFQTICSQPVPEDDGLVFLPETVVGAPAREDQEYQGASLKLIARLVKAEIHLQIDFGFGDVLTPAAEVAELPILLDLPAPRLLTYPKETVVAEKLQAMVLFDMANSRMKDFYDIWYLSQRFDFDDRLLAQAIAATFQRRKTELPTQPPTALTAEFHEDPTKQSQWNSFVAANRLTDTGLSLAQVVDALQVFLMPPLLAAAEGNQLRASWRYETGRWHAYEPQI